VVRTEVITQTPGPDPMLIPNSGRDGTQFFNNKGAVAGVFLLVGLAGLAIVLFLLFWMKKRRKTKERDADAALAASLGAAGLSRSPIDGDEFDDNGSGSSDLMSQYRTRRSSSGEDPFATHQRRGSYTYPTPGSYLHAPLDGLTPLMQPGYEHDRHHGQTTEAVSRPVSFGPVTPASRLSTQGGPAPIPYLSPKYSPPMAEVERHEQAPDDQDYFGNGQRDARLNPYLLPHIAANGSGVSLGDHQDYSRPLTVSPALARLAYANKYLQARKLPSTMQLSHS
jgi:hypothetical protein